MNRKLLALALGAAFMGGSGAANATVPVVIDFDGSAATNSDVVAKSLEWTIGNALSETATPTQDDYVGTVTDGDGTNIGDSVTLQFQFDSQVYFQAVLGTYVNTAGTGIAPTGLNTSFEWTVVAGVNETVSLDVKQTVIDFGDDGVPGGTGVNADTYTISTLAVFTEAAVEGDNFYRIYYDNVINDGTFGYNLEGTGFTDGQLILEGKVIDTAGSFSAPELYTFIDLDGDGTLSAGDTVTTTYTAMDGSNPDDWSSDTLKYLSIEGQGVTDFNVDISFADDAFFKDEITMLVQDGTFNTSNLTPYEEQDPSKRFTQGDGTVLLNCTDFFLSLDCTDGTAENPNYITNGLDGPSILLQSDANSAFNISPIPEPSLLALLGVSLGIFGMIGVRGRKGKTTT